MNQRPNPEPHRIRLAPLNADMPRPSRGSAPTDTQSNCTRLSRRTARQAWDTSDGSKAPNSEPSTGHRRPAGFDPEPTFAGRRYSTG